MSLDPLAWALEETADPYGSTEARRTILQAIQRAHPELVTDTIESFLERLTLLEMYLEEEKQFSIDKDELADFLARNLPRVRKETAKLANLFYGSIAHREGG